MPLLLLHFKVFSMIKKKTKKTTNKIWVDKGSEFYHRSMKSWLQDNNIEMKENLLLLKDLLEV